MSQPNFIRKVRRLLGGEGTVLEGTLDAMGRQRDSQTLERAGEFIDRVVVIVEKLEEVVQSFAADRYEDLAQAAKELGRLESQIDDVKEDILDELCTGGVCSAHRASLDRLVSSMDSIANLASGAVDRLKVRKITLPREMNEDLVALARVDVEATKALREALLAMREDLHEAIKLAASVDKLESRADELYASMYRTLFDMDIDFKTFNQLKSMLDRLEGIADRCSENAELLRHMALEYLEER